MNVVLTCYAKYETGLGTEAPQTVSKHIAEVSLSNTVSPYKNQ